MKLSWKAVQKKLSEADRHAKEASKTAGMALDLVLGKPKGKSRGKTKPRAGVMVKGKCTCPK